MGRWKPDAQGRLIQAAMELFSEHGYEQTTVAEIAERAGLTERTFFRYFTDKREVLFLGSHHLEHAMAEALERAPASLAPIDAIGVALESAAQFFNDRRPHARRRQAVINANPELQERERQKLASLAAAFSAGLQKRGAKAPAATLAAEMGVAIFKIAFERWLTDPDDRGAEHHVRESLKELRSLTHSSD
jgi:AcrR family transcriptional regulator